jgi:sugar transport protein
MLWWRHHQSISLTFQFISVGLILGRSTRCPSAIPGWISPSPLPQPTLRTRFPLLEAVSEKLFGTIAGVFWLYAGVCAISFFWVLKYLPETKGRSREEIARSWELEARQISALPSPFKTHRAAFSWNRQRRCGRELRDTGATPRPESRHRPRPAAEYLRVPGT